MRNFGINPQHLGAFIFSLFFNPVAHLISPEAAGKDSYGIKKMRFLAHQDTWRCKRCPPDSPASTLASLQFLLNIATRVIFSKYGLALAASPHIVGKPTVSPHCLQTNRETIWILRLLMSRVKPEILSILPPFTLSVLQSN